MGLSRGLQRLRGMLEVLVMALMLSVSLSLSLSLSVSPSVSLSLPSMGYVLPISLGCSGVFSSDRCMHWGVHLSSILFGDAMVPNIE